MPTREKFTFTGSSGDELAGLLELPDVTPRATALFAHCFTCGKDLVGASRIARSLVGKDIAVMRFDFTGLGGSDGDFGNTNFSSNVQDLLAAADHLRDVAQAPSLLIGHSLGGTAVLNAAGDIPECLGVVTIGSPADAQHIAKQFACEIDTIEREGQAEVTLAGRAFTIKKQFLDDIGTASVDLLKHLKPALLVMHSPVDATVSIREAERIYQAANHPKSFISLNTADHLLTQRADAEYVADIVASWAARFLPESIDERPGVGSGELKIQERDHKFMLDVFSDTHRWLADEPVRVGGKNTGPDPYEHLLAAVGSCTAMTVRMYADHKKWPLDDVLVTLSHAREHQQDCADCDDKPLQLDVIQRRIELHGSLDEKQLQRLMQIADKCPVHRTLTGQLEIRTEQV